MNLELWEIRKVGKNWEIRKTQVENGTFTRELDFGVSGLLSDYIEKYGIKGRDDILAMLGYLAWKVQETYLEVNRKDLGGIMMEGKSK